MIEPPRVDAVAQNLLAGRSRLFQLAGLARIEQNDGVHVAVARVEDVADGEAVLLRDLADEVQGGRDLGARHHAILHVVGRADAAHRAEGVLAALPEQVALFGRSRHAELARAALVADLANLLDLLLHHFAQAFELDQQHRGGVHGIAGVRGLFHHAQHHAIEHLDRDRRDGARGDLGDGVAGVFVRFVDRQNAS